MKRTGIAGALLVPGLLLLTLAGQSPRQAEVDQLASTPAAPATVTDPAAQAAEAPVVVPNASAAVARGFSASFADASDTGGYSQLPSDVLAAYSNAVAVSPVDCRLTVSVLAAIGQVESGNLVGHGIDAGHRASPAVIGPVLDGKRFASVRDTDNGTLDGDKRWDRAVGPMQFLPSTWRTVGVDMDGDGLRDPQSIFDAAGGTMVYLCSGARDLGTADGLRAAVLSYNHSTAYLSQGARLEGRLRRQRPDRCLRPRPGRLGGAVRRHHLRLHPDGRQGPVGEHRPDPRRDHDPGGRHPVHRDAVEAGLLEPRDAGHPDPVRPRHRRRPVPRPRAPRPARRRRTRRRRRPRRRPPRRRRPRRRPPRRRRPRSRCRRAPCRRRPTRPSSSTRSPASPSRPRWPPPRRWTRPTRARRRRPTRPTRRSASR